VDSTEHREGAGQQVCARTYGAVGMLTRNTSGWLCALPAHQPDKPHHPGTQLQQHAPHSSTHDPHKQHSRHYTHVDDVVGLAPRPVCGAGLGVARAHEDALWGEAIDRLEGCGLGVLEGQLDL
jgi:hypothetical protein